MKTKILLYSLLDYNIFTAFVDHLINWGIFCLSKEEFEIKCLINEKFGKINDFYKQLDNYECYVISDEEIHSVFHNDFLSKIEKNQKLSFKTLNNFEQKRFENIVKNKLNNWVPDIILSNYASAPKTLFNNMYPNALFLNNDNALFCRPPFPRTLAYDDVNPIDCFFVRYKNEIANIKTEEWKNEKIEQFKKNLQKIIHDNTDETIINEILKYKKKFRKIILCPLVGTLGNTLFEKAYFNNDFDLLEYVLSTTPSDIGVFVTEHDFYGVLNNKTIEYFRKKYPNFIFLNSTYIKGYASNSLNYFEYVDAVINTTSKTGYLATIWDKPIISLAKDYNDLIKDSDGLEDIDALWDKTLPDKNHILYWYLTRYCIPIVNLQKEDYFKNYLLNKLNYFRNNGIDFDFMFKINDIDEIITHILSEVNNYYAQNGPIVKSENNHDLIKQQLRIVLITYNRKKYLQDTLDSILADNSPVKDFDITVINNNSTDGTTELLDAYADKYKNITHVINKINIGGNANIAKAYCEHLDKKYIWVLCDNDYYNWDSWDEVEYAISNDFDVIMTRNCKNNISELFYKANLVSSVIYKTKNITSSVVENMYDNIRYIFPHLAIMAENLNNNKSVYIVNKDIVQVGVNPGYATTIYRGRKTEEVPPFKRNMYWSVGFFNSLALINERKKRIEIIEGLKHYHKTLFDLFKTIMIYNKTIANNYMPNLLSIFQFLSCKQKIKFIWAYILIQFSFKNYKYWFIRYEEEWLEYLRIINTQQYINKLVKKLKNKKIILYGAGLFAKILFENYDLSGLNIVGISDKKFETSEETEAFNIKTLKPDELKTTDFDIILFTLKEYLKIEKLLKRNGIKQKMLPLIRKNKKYPVKI